MPTTALIKYGRQKLISLPVHQHTSTSTSTTLHTGVRNLPKVFFIRQRPSLELNLASTINQLKQISLIFQFDAAVIKQQDVNHVVRLR